MSAYACVPVHIQVVVECVYLLGCLMDGERAKICAILNMYLRQVYINVNTPQMLPKFRLIMALSLYIQ